MLTESSAIAKINHLRERYSRLHVLPLSTNPSIARDPKQRLHSPYHQRLATQSQEDETSRRSMTCQLAQAALFPSLGSLAFHAASHDGRASPPSHLRGECACTVGAAEPAGNLQVMDAAAAVRVSALAPS